MKTEHLEAQSQRDNLGFHGFDDKSDDVMMQKTEHGRNSGSCVYMYTKIRKVLAMHLYSLVL